MKLAKQIIPYPLIALFASLSALNYAIFIFPNSFAPAGVDGICTMIQDVGQISMGYLSLLVNVPLLIAAFLLLDREFAMRTAVYVLAFSVATVCLRHVDLSAFQYRTETSTSIVLAPIAAGAIRGMLYAVTLRCRASSGGTDIIAALIKRSHPYFNLMNVIFALNMAIALCSYVVYDFRIEPVICSILYSFVTSTVSSRLRQKERELIKYEIITPDAEALCSRLLAELGCTATVVDAHGAYSGAEKKMVICIVQKQKAFRLEKIALDFTGTIFFKSDVQESFTKI